MLSEKIKQGQNPELKSVVSGVGTINFKFKSNIMLLVT